jgi:hypothetical protein
VALLTILVSLLTILVSLLTILVSLLTVLVSLLTVLVSGPAFRQTPSLHPGAQLDLTLNGDKILLKKKRPQTEALFQSRKLISSVLKTN